jgi:ketosteroid isomerase-like protein
MKSTMKAGVVLLMVLLGGTAPGAASAQEENKAEHDALRLIRQVVEKAVNSNDLDLIQPYLTPDFSIVTFTDREFTDFDAFKTQWGKTRRKMLGERGTFKVDLDPELSVIKGDIALCRGNARNAMRDNGGNVFEFTSHWTATCQKVDGKWLVVRAHNSTDPFNNPIVMHEVRKLVIESVAAAMLLGLVLGAGIMWGRHRRKVRASGGEGQ